MDRERERDLRMAEDAGEVVFGSKRQCKKAVVDKEMRLADDVKRMAEQQVVVSVHAAADRVLYWDNRLLRPTPLHRLQTTSWSDSGFKKV